MVSHSSHTNHVFLILVIRVTNVSFAIESFVSNEIVLIIMLHMKKIFLVTFLFFNTMNLLIYYKLVFEKFCKKQVRKKSAKSSKTSIKNKTPLKL